MAVWAVYKLYIDWDNDGDYSDQYEDISSYITESGVSFDYGRDRDSQLSGRSTVGSFRAEVDNASGLFSRFNAGSPIKNSIKPGRRIKYTMQIGVGLEQTLFTGRLLNITLNSAPERKDTTATITGQGIFGIFQKRGNVNIPMQAAIKSGDAIEAILDAVNWDQYARVIDEGKSTLVRYWTGGSVSALQALRDVEDTEAGFLRESKDGSIVFEDRSHRFLAPHTASRASYTNDPSGAIRYVTIKPVDTLDEIYNIVQAKVRTFNLSEEKTLWNAVNIFDTTENVGAPILLPAGQAVVIEAVFPTPSSNSNEIAVVNWTIVTFLANTSEEGAGTDTTTEVDIIKEEFDNLLRLTFTNNYAYDTYIVQLYADGIAIVEGDGIQVSSDDAYSIADYGECTYPFPGKFLTAREEAQAFCDYFVDLYKDQRVAIQLTLDGNVSLNHLTEVQTVDVSDRITVTSDEGINGDFFVEHVWHNISRNGIHNISLLCSEVPAVSQWAASDYVYVPRTVTPPDVVIIKAPDDLEVVAIDPAGRILISVSGWKYNDTILEAEFRAKFYAGVPPDVADLRNIAEGGTLVDNGITERIFTGYAATPQGGSLQFQSTLRGRWFFAARLRNSSGWSVWSDGNETPNQITSYVDTEGGLGADTGGPSYSSVLVTMQNSAAVVTTSRPAYNSKNILNHIVQLRDASVNGAWRALDANTGAAQTYYDGSGIDHVFNQKTGTLTKASGDWGSADLGGLLLVDVSNAGTFDVQNCLWAIIPPNSTYGLSMDGIPPGIWMNAVADTDGCIWEHVRVKLVKPPWEWDTEGYLGYVPSQGYAEQSFYGAGQQGNKLSVSFVSAPIELPENMVMGSIVARVWMQNKICISEVGNTTVNTLVDEDNPSGAHDLVVLTHTEDPNISEGMMVLQWYRDTQDYQNIFAMGFLFHMTDPAQGPFWDQREAFPYRTLETGICTITAGSPNIAVSRYADSSVVGRMLCIFQDYGYPDIALDANMIAEEGTDSLTLFSSGVFHKSGDYEYAIIETYWPGGTDETTNFNYLQLAAPADIGGSINSPVWRSPQMSRPQGDFYVTGFSRNPFGFGTPMTAQSTIALQPFSGYCILLEDANPIILDCSLINGNGKVFRLNLIGDRTIQAINGVCGLPIALIVEQGVGGGHLITWDTMFRNGEDLPILRLSTPVGALDYLGFMYSATDDKYDAVACMRGYLP